MKDDKKYIPGWLPYYIGFLVLGGIVFSVMNLVGMIGKTVLERKVFEQSYQRTEALNSQEILYMSIIASLEARLLDPNLDESLRYTIESQLTAIRIQLNSNRGR